MDNELFMNTELQPPPEIAAHFEQPSCSSPMLNWPLMNPNLSQYSPPQDCFTWEKSTEQQQKKGIFDSALSSLVSSPTPSNSNFSGCGGGDGFIIRELIGKLSNSSATPNRTTPLTEFSGDPGFAERAARFSCFGSRSFNGRTNSTLPVNNSKIVNSGKLTRVASTPALNSLVSPMVPAGEFSRKRKSVSKGKSKEIPLPTASPAPSFTKSLRSLSPRGVDVSFCRNPIDESSLDRRVLTRPTSRHSTVLSSLDRRFVTRPTSRHSTDDSSLDRRVVTRPTSRHSTDESSLDRRVVTRPTSRHSTVLSSLDRSVTTRSTSRHLTDESSLDRRVPTRPKSRHSIVLSSLGAERSLAVASLDLSRPHFDRRVLTSTDESSLDQRVLTQPKSRHSTVLLSLGAEHSLAVAPFSYSLRVVSIRFKLSIKTSPNPTDESSSRLFTSLLIVLVRREKIGERMKLLEDLVPGCNKVTGKALMLDEIINYVQSLQRQVEFLSMKLSSVNDTRLEFNVDALVSKDVMIPTSSNRLHEAGLQAESLSHHSYNNNSQLHTNVSSCNMMLQSPVNSLETSTLASSFTHLPTLTQFTDSISQYQMFSQEDLQSIVGMGVAHNPNHESQNMKIEL
ncbi:hypothetical protein HID58_049377 [Brassica napus]|uniref:BHLH domain-containing protein n=1 Tax=Brassica napus TaxID=3708 RepID=A0ABQ8B4S5_BRANA|nr:hypothetical protein HID58_049377 [Brassica napus]